MVSLFVREHSRSGVLQYNNMKFPISATYVNHDGVKHIIESNFLGNKLELRTSNSFSVFNINSEEPTFAGTVYLNDSTVGTYTAFSNTGKAVDIYYSIHLKDTAVINFYIIAFGKEYFVFGYENEEVVMCAHKNNYCSFTIFANNEWYTHLMAIYIAQTFFFEEMETEKTKKIVVTLSVENVNKYDPNYISEVLKSETREVQEQYKHLIHLQVDKNKIIELEKKKKQKFVIFASIFATALFFIILFLFFLIYF